MKSLPPLLVVFAINSITIANPVHAEPFGMKPIDRIRIVHAEGAQIYECSADKTGASWKFKEPIASLFESGRTIGRHYAGPSWEFADGTVVTARVMAQAPSATSDDIPELMLAITGSRGSSPVATARTILRLKTKGGVAHGPCSTPGELKSVAYSAEYAFFSATSGN